MQNFEPGKKLETSKKPYLEFGRQGRLFHFAHANGYPPGAYTPLFQSLLPSCHVLAMEQRPLWQGYEPSKLADWRPLAQDLKEFLRKRLDTIKPIGKNLVGAGHSMGATTTLRLALQEPSLFSALVLIDPVIFLPWMTIAWKAVMKLNLGMKVHPLAARTLRRRRIFDSKASMFEHYRAKPVFQRMPDESLWAYVSACALPMDTTSGKVELRYSPDWEARIYLTGSLADLDLWKNLGSLHLPTLVIRGEASNTFHEKTARRMQKLAPQLKIITTPGTGHLAPLEKPMLVAETILEFLEAETGL